MATYQWRGVAKGKKPWLGKKLASVDLEALDAQVIGEHLEAIRKTNGRLTSMAIVEDARSPNSPTHCVFTWDDAIAADKWRLEEATTLVQAVHLVVPEQSTDEKVVTTRAFVSVYDEDSPRAGSCYEPLATVLGDTALYAQVCRRACAELEAFQDRYAQFQSLKSIGKAAIDAAQAELARAISGAEAAA